MLKDKSQSQEFRESKHWKSSLLDFTLRVRTDQRNVFKSNSLSGNERNRLVMGGPDSAYQERTLVSGVDCREDARSFALMDIDRDGWVDIALASCNGPRLRFFRNRFGDLGGTGRVVEVTLRGSHDGSEPAVAVSNRDGVGAIVKAMTNRRTRAFRKSIGEGLAAQNSERIRITLAEGETLEQIEVRWPSGKVSSVKPSSSALLLHISE